MVPEPLARVVDHVHVHLPERLVLSLDVGKWPLLGFALVLTWKLVPDDREAAARHGSREFVGLLLWAV